jgi:hypothetical protein
MKYHRRTEATESVASMLVGIAALLVLAGGGAWIVLAWLEGLAGSLQL